MSGKSYFFYFYTEKERKERRERKWYGMWVSLFMLERRERKNQLSDVREGTENNKKESIRF